MSALRASQRAFLDEILATGECAPGMEVYRRGVAENQRGALAAAFPVVQRLVGEAFFREAASRYARACPSRSGDLHEFGAGMARFLETYPYAAGLPYLADVARLEWALHEAFHAADAAALDLAALAAVPGERHAELRFALHPSVRRIASDHPVLAIWEANQASRDGTPERGGPERVLVARADGVARPRAVGEPEWLLLESLAEGLTLGEAHDRLGESAAAAIPPALARYAREGIVCGFEPSR
jgi:hypothetical protein